MWERKQHTCQGERDGEVPDSYHRNCEQNSVAQILCNCFDQSTRLDAIAALPTQNPCHMLAWTNTQSTSLKLGRTLHLCFQAAVRAVASARHKNSVLSQTDSVFSVWSSAFPPCMNQQTNQRPLLQSWTLNFSPQEKMTKIINNNNSIETPMIETCWQYCSSRIHGVQNWFFTVVA